MGTTPDRLHSEARYRACYRASRRSVASSASAFKPTSWRRHAVWPFWLWPLALAATTVVHANDADEFLKQRIFQHEQCANVCQIAFDKELYQCMPYRPDKEREVPEDCALVAKERFEKCMQSCPADPRAK